MVPETSDDIQNDPWMPSLSATAAIVSTDCSFPGIRITQLQNVGPLDAQVGIFPKKAVPDGLHRALFSVAGVSQAAPADGHRDRNADQRLYTYAILDAAKVANLPELLEQSGLEHRCLFKNEAYEELKNVAPWVVRLEEGNRFTRFLFTKSDAAQHLWGAKPGIFIRSDASLDELYRHLRKFTRIQDEQGKWHFLAYWSHPLGVQTFLRAHQLAISPIAQRILALTDRRLMIVIASDDASAIIEYPEPREAVRPRWLLTRAAWEFIRKILARAAVRRGRTNHLAARS